MKERMDEPPGQKVATLLAGSWRRETALFEDTGFPLEDIAPLLIGSGAGGLGWWRIRDSNLRDFAPAFELQQAFRFQTLRASLQERKIQDIFEKLQKANIEPLLLKGWACARPYPAKGLRPLGDIDLYVLPSQLKRAAEVLNIPTNASTTGHEIDLKSGLPPYYELTIETLFERSQVVGLNGTSIRIPSAEDHLRIICIHFLKHGAWRPLWLCDIAAALENRPKSFDWERCLGTEKRSQTFILYTIELAHQMLGADIRETPIEVNRHHLPKWLLSAAWQQWDRPCIVDHRPPELMAESLRQNFLYPKRMGAALAKRWPNSIETLVAMRVPLAVYSPLPWQCAQYLKVSCTFLYRLVQSGFKISDGKNQ